MSESKNTKTLKVIQGIAQAAANGFDGALDDKGEPIKIGLKREEGHPIHQSRIYDGFKARIHADKLILSYNTEVRIKDVHNPRFENDQRGAMNDILSWLRKEYSKITGDTLSLTVTKEPHVKVQHISRVKTLCTVTCVYKINDIDVATSSPYQSKNDKWRDFVKQGGWNK